MQRSVDWYQNVLGFKVEDKMEREGTVVSVRLTAGAVQIRLNLDNGARGWDRKKGEGISLMFRTEQNIDELADHIKAAGGTIDMGPQDMPWGARMMRIYDPDGFKFAIST